MALPVIDSEAKLRAAPSTMLANGIICSPQGLGCLTTPMGTAEVDQFIRASETALRAVRDRFGAD